MNNDFLDQEIPFDELEDYKDSPLKDKFKTVGSVLKSYSELEKKIGHKRTAIPTESSTDEEWNEFYADLRPENPTDYDDVLEDLVGEDQKKTLGETFHANGLSKRQAKAIMGEISKTLNTRFNSDYGQEDFDKAMEEFGENKQALTDEIDQIFGADFVKSSTDAPNKTIAMLAKAIQYEQKKYAVKDPVKPKGGTAIEPGAKSQADNDIAFYNALKSERAKGTLTRERFKELEKQYNQQ